MFPTIPTHRCHPRSPLSFRATSGSRGTCSCSFTAKPQSLRKDTVHRQMFPTLPTHRCHPRSPLSFRATNGSRGTCSCSFTAKPQSLRKDTVHRQMFPTLPTHRCHPRSPLTRSNNSNQDLPYPQPSTKPKLSISKSPTLHSYVTLPVTTYPSPTTSRIQPVFFFFTGSDYVLLLSSAMRSRRDRAEVCSSLGRRIAWRLPPHAQPARRAD